MSAVLLGNAVHDTPEWHALRAGGIGASEISAVVGLSQYVSAFQLWHVKKGNLPGQRTKPHMGWGHRLEPVVRGWWLEQHQEFGCQPNPGTYAHSERDWQRVNPDGLLYLNDDDSKPTALYEGKISRFGDGFGKSGTDEIPISYRCQVQHAMDVFGLNRCYVAVLIGGSEARKYVIEADPQDQETLRNAGRRFWESVHANDEPPIDCSEMTYRAVRDLNPLIERDAAINLDPHLWAEYLEHKAEADRHSELLTGVKSRILASMGTARSARFAEMTVLRRQMSSAGTPYLKEVS